MKLSCASCDKNCNTVCSLEQEYHSLISTLSHEVKNQLTLINSSLQLVAKEYPAVSKLTLWPQIDQDLQNTINLLKDFSSLAGKDRLNPKPFRVLDFLESITVSVASLMQENSICFRTHFDESLHTCVICADAGKLREAATNLLLNAADAVSEHTASGCITLSGYLESGCLCIHVKDNGPGIPKEYLPTLFEPFVTHKSHGTGLGLAITKNILEQHRGTVTVYTCTKEPNTYTEFCMKLPYLP